jgi:heptaprenyl diphosphate synthase
VTGRQAFGELTSRTSIDTDRIEDGLVDPFPTLLPGPENLYRSVSPCAPPVYANGVEASPDWISCVRNFGRGRRARDTSCSGGSCAMIDENHSDACRRLVDAWLREFISVGDRRIGRSGPVCPFIPRALAQHAVETAIRYDIDGSSGPELSDKLRAEISEFGKKGRPPHNTGVLLESRLIVMPRMDPEGWERLNAVHAYLKNYAAELGLMIGQFHPDCDERAVRNSGFRVSIAPIAMLAIRHMAPHDILFLHHSERWFKEYDSRFRSHFRIRDSLLLSLYSRARDRYGLST